MRSQALPGDLLTLRTVGKVAPLCDPHHKTPIRQRQPPRCLAPSLRERQRLPSASCSQGFVLLAARERDSWLLSEAFDVAVTVSNRRDVRLCHGRCDIARQVVAARAWWHDGDMEDGGYRSSWLALTLLKSTNPLLGSTGVVQDG